MSLFNTISFTRKRRTGSYVDGRWVESGVTTDTPFTGTRQMPTGKDMQVLPEGRRLSEVYIIYTATELFAVQNADSNPTPGNAEIPCDIVVDGATEYEVIHVEPWRNGIINHYKAWIAKALEGTR